MTKRGGKKGFTLVELSLAVGFIALLSLTVSMIINDTVATYRRGLTLNQINTTGMDLVDDMRAVIQSSPAQAVTHECEALFSGGRGADTCEADNASSLIILERYADVEVRDGEKVNIPVYGAICTGAFSYIWNSGYFFGDNAANERIKGINPATFTYDQNNNGTLSRVTIGDTEKFRLLKVKDDRRAVCKSVLKKNDREYNNYRSSGEFKNTLSNQFNISTPGGYDVISYYDSGIRADDIEIVLKDESTNPLALYDFTITPPISNIADEAAFYSASFILGTLEGGINVNAMGNFCKVPSDYDNNFNYCAINKFNFAAQATGG